MAATDDDLLFISKATKSTLNSMRHGAALVQSAGQGIDALRDAATRDRLALARTMLASAERAVRGRVDGRTATSRAYYALYHTFRAVVFYMHGGDDHESHSKLPLELPNDLPNRATWQNAMKSARLERNKADYDPYPRVSADFLPVAKQMIHDAHDAATLAATYLSGKGLPP